MSCTQCRGIEQEFNPKLVGREVRNYRRNGARKTTRLLIDALKRENIEGKTLLDIGGGIGAIQFELLERGVSRATGVDASSAYLQAVRDEASLRGYTGRIDSIYGDFVDVAPRIEPADIVTLDRVICCYPNLHGLIDASAARARTLYGLVYPREDWWMTVAVSMINLIFRIRRSPMRFFVHPTREVEKSIRRYGFELQAYLKTLTWQVAVYRR